MTMKTGHIYQPRQVVKGQSILPMKVAVIAISLKIAIWVKNSSLRSEYVLFK